MKIILAGATGFIGSNVLKQCISNPKVSSIIVVSRRGPAKELTASSKVRVILHQDFSDWPTSLLDQVEGAEGCIWTVGGKVSDFPNMEIARKVGIDYTLIAANVFATTLALLIGKAGRKFPFVFCSGYGAQQNEDARVFVLPDTRKIKGAAEKGLFDIAAANTSFETFVLRPGGVLPSKSRVAYTIVAPLVPVVYVSDLAKALLATCLTQPASKVIENKEIIRVAKSIS